MSNELRSDWLDLQQLKIVFFFRFYVIFEANLKKFQVNRENKTNYKIKANS